MKIKPTILSNRRNTNSLKWHGAGNGVLPMWVADMDFKCPEPVLKKIGSIITQGDLGYSIIDQKYYSSVESWFNTRYQLALKVENIIPVTGVIPALRAIIEEFSLEGDQIIIQPPVYYPFADSIKNSKRNILDNPLSCSEFGQYNINYSELEVIKKFQPKIFVLCSPHNPVGRIWSKQELEEIGDYCIENKILLVVDEIHCDLIFPGKHFISFAALDEKYLENCIILTSPTKTFNFAGLRGGNVFIFNDRLKEALIRRFNRQGLDKLNSLYVAATTEAYLFCSEWLESVIRYIHKNYLYVISFIKKELKKLIVTSSEATYLVWVNYTRLNIREEIFLKELSRNLIVSEGAIFGENGRGWIRLNIACSFEMVVSAMELLKKTVNKYQ